MKEQKIGIALSGGVDSTACALLLRNHHHVKGFFMRLAQPNFDSQLARVQSIAGTLGISLEIIDLREIFNQKVLDYFANSYYQGLTPNPCVICNQEIKFGLFMEAILGAGMDKMATGHYAKIRSSEGLYRLYCGADPKKDQSYFLSRLNQQQLSCIIFPLGDQKKETTYTLVESYGFDDFRGRESQDVCFLENRQLGNFLENRSAADTLPGPIVSTSGKVLGSHSGLFRYTIGQRKGLGISSSAPLYVVGLDASRNSVIVGSNKELFKKQIEVKDLHWLTGTAPKLSQQYSVRIRYSHRGSLASVALHGKDYGQIIFSEPQRAVTPGQFAVIYNDTELLGSGIII